MKFKNNWLKKFFSRKPREMRVVKAIPTFWRNIITGRTWERDMVIYEEFNPITKDLYRVYAKGYGKHVEIDLDYYKKTGEMIPK